MKKQSLVLKDAPELSLVEGSKADQIKKTFEPMVEMLKGFDESFNDLIKESESGITHEVTIKAKRLRLDIAQVRIKTGKLKDKQKEKIKLEDKAIMGVHNILVWSVSDKENALKEIEDHFETLEKERLENLQKERVLLLSEYVEDAHDRDLSKFEEDEFDALLSIKKQAKEDKVAAEKQAEEDKVAAEKQAEEDRIELERKRKLEKQRTDELIPIWNYLDFGGEDLGEISDEKFNSIKSKGEKKKADHEVRIKNQEQENERLKKEAEEKDIAERERKEKEEAEARTKEVTRKFRAEELVDLVQFIPDYEFLITLPEEGYKLQLKKIKVKSSEFWEKERLSKIEKEKEQKEAQDRLNSEKEAREKLESEAKAREESGRKIKEEENRVKAMLIEAERVASLAPEKEKISSWIDGMRINIIGTDGFSKEGIEVCIDVSNKFEAFKKWASDQKDLIK